MSLHLHSSKRRPAPLVDADYDHEITLVDATRSTSAHRSPSRSLSRQIPGSPGPSPNLSDSDSRRHSNVPLRKRDAPEQIHEELTKRKYRKYLIKRPGERSGIVSGVTEESEERSPGNEGIREQEEERGRTKDTMKTKKPPEPESAIDILYENQRGGFLCGLALFSSRALGGLDPAPWTNIALKTSATNITNAQVPDPSWEWLWKGWSINHTEQVDDEGWEYSFAFPKAFSWHGPSWWNSFVRRRAWIRKRVKKKSGYAANEAHMLNPDYFTIHSNQLQSRSRASSQATQNRRSASLARREMEEPVVLEDIKDISALMKALRLARIDREKMEAVESFIKNGGDDLYYLREQMHEIMHMFIFQASRRSLLTYLLKTFNEASVEKEDMEDEKDVRASKLKRLENLEAALKAADEEVKKLEFWSDVKDMAEDGITKGAVDEKQGWDNRWQGLDDSGPKDVISDRKLVDTDDRNDGGRKASNGSVKSKGKAKA